MGLRIFLAIVAFTDVLAWIAWALFARAVGPDSGLAAIILFYAIMSLALFGLFAVIGFLVRIYLVRRDEVIAVHINRVFRQSALFTALVVCALVFIHKGLLHSWALLVLVAAFAGIEYLFSHRDV